MTTIDWSWINRPVSAGLLVSAALALGAISVEAMAQGPSDENRYAKPRVVQPRKGVSPQDVVITPGSTLIWFAPQDNDATCTVINLMNISANDATVVLTGYDGPTGALVYSQTIAVPKKNFVRVVSDSVTASPPPSWTNQAGKNPTIVVANFTDFTYYARMVLPQNVFADGYITWDSSGLCDPRAEKPRLPLRFWTRSLN